LKRPYLILLFIAITTVGFFLNFGCKKAKDTTPPIILLKGSNPLYVGLDTIYIDPGARAQDNVDGDISSKIIVTGISAINTSKKGKYLVNYSVTDAAGNSYSAIRTVYVWNIADSLAGNYPNVIDSCLSLGPGGFSSTITSSDNVNGMMTFYNFLAQGDSIVGILHYNDTISFITPQVLVGSDSLISAFGVESFVDTAFTTAGLPITSRVITLYYKWYNGISYDSCYAIY
jgi:hypothetical protein